MTIEVKRLDCPNCGTPLDLKNAGRSRSVVCPSCHSQIDLTSPDNQVVGNVGERPLPLLTPFEPGQRGTIEGVEYEVIGRVRYRDPEGYPWDEWLLLSAEGAYRWLSDSDDEGLTYWEGFTPAEPVDPATIEAGSVINLTGERERIRARGDARIEYLEGELTWKARVGDTMNYAEGEGAGELHSIEWTQDEVEFYRGHKLDRRTVEQAFGITSSAASGGPSGKRTTSCTMIIVVLIVIFACVIVAGIAGGGHSSGSSSSSGSSIRFGSPGRSLGGGFHGSSSHSSGHGGK